MPNPRETMFNTTAVQTRYRQGRKDGRGGTINTDSDRIRVDGEVLAGFPCGFYPTGGSIGQAGGDAALTQGTFYCDQRDLRIDDVLTLANCPGLVFAVKSTRFVPQAGDISAFMTARIITVRDQSVVQSESPEFVVK